MNREEAIANLNMISVAFVDPVTKEQRKLIDDTFDMAIKALEQEPCEDAIDRKLVCAFIAGLISDDGEREKGLEYIRHMPPVNPTNTGHWIPVSERLPKEDGLYLVYTEEQPFVCPFKDSEFFIDEVLAWMPLPESYKGE